MDYLTYISMKCVFYYYENNYNDSDKQFCKIIPQHTYFVETIIQWSLDNCLTC